MDCVVRQGSTPCMFSRAPQKVDLNLASEIWFTVKQGDTIIADRCKSKDELQIKNNCVYFFMTQEETLSILPKRKLKLQIRVYFPNSEGPAHVSNIAYVDAEEALKGGIIGE